jgi:prepilin-type processing-associated H-X9-DG protein
VKVKIAIHQSFRNGFTLVELVAILGIVLLAALALLPARANSRTKAQSVRCIENMRQVIGAVQMFTHDHQDLLPPNPDDGTTQPGFTWCAGQVGIGGADQFDPDILSDPTRCLISTYLGSNVSVFRCTADSRTGTYDGGALYPNSPLKGKRVPAARTISMNHAVGTIDPCYASGSGHCGNPTLPVNGPWLTGSYGANTAANGPYRTYGKTSQMVIPTPAELLVISEEAPYSINDGVLAAVANLSNRRWVDFPSPLHNNGCVVSFADGHVEFHKWMGQSLNSTTLPSAAVLPTDPDWLWLAQHISARMR